MWLQNALTDRKGNPVYADGQCDHGSDSKLGEDHQFGFVKKAASRVKKAASRVKKASSKALSKAKDKLKAKHKPSPGCGNTYSWHHHHSKATKKPMTMKKIKCYVTKSTICLHVEFSGTDPTKPIRQECTSKKVSWCVDDTTNKMVELDDECEHKLAQVTKAG